MDAPPKTMGRIGFDAERAFWEETMYLTCEIQQSFET
jgi:alpha 1,2-mannosyltransferase